MRNLFDQYSQQENRLTHALAVCLDCDRFLLQRFLRWLNITPRKNARLFVEEQTLPGETQPSEEEAERRGLPDLLIHDGSTWCLLLESKVQAALTMDQLSRHERTMRRRGFEHVTLVALTKSHARVTRNVVVRCWCDLYDWLGRVGTNRPWAERLRAYLRVAEERLAREEYLTEGTLTMFDGFPFSHQSPYTYGEAKRLLKLAMIELRKDKELKKLGMDPAAPGRPAITGRDGKSVWDFLQLKDRPSRGLFTSFPHLTLSINDRGVAIHVTIPSAVITPVRRRLGNLGDAGLIDLNRRILRKASRLVRRGAVVEAYAVQNHFTSQRAKGQEDARVSFKLETSQNRGSRGIKHRAEWNELFASLLRRRRANIQFGYGIQLPWGMPDLNRRASLKLIVEAWFALEPLLHEIRA
jgi:hypothetical protein